jgi:tetraacyldisaccharide 4'-kinase
MKFSRPLRILLWPASLLYGAVVAIRTALYAGGFFKRKRLKTPVISVGNLTVGGTGKTPLVIWLANRLLQQGKRVAILSRGYRGTAGTSDEIELMKARLQNRVSFGVGKNRFIEGSRIESREAVDVFLLDDGFQHLQLARDLDIVLMDASRPIAPGMLPSGPMREDASALSRAGMIVFTRTESAFGANEAIQHLSNLPVFAASTALRGFRLLSTKDPLRPAPALTDGPFFAFCGIGNPDAFLRDLKNWGIATAGHMFFRDHRRYTVEDAQAIEGSARRAGAKTLVTTEKDSFNLSAAKFSLPVYIAVIDLHIENEMQFLATVENAIQARGVLV